jgi:hypothetical protein
MKPRRVTIATYDKTAEAAVARMYLEACGISVFMMDEPMVGLDWLSSTAPGEIKLQVAEADVDQAVAQLGELSQSRQPEGAETDEEVCLSCGSPMRLDWDCCAQCGWTYLEK